MKLEMLVPIPSFATVLPLQKHHKTCTRLHVKAQSLHDEGRSSNIVDSNMKLLKERIEFIHSLRHSSSLYFFHPCSSQDVNNHNQKKEVMLLTRVLYGLIIKY
ncbi:hypothetical protein R6Q59_033712 [Mikania micrantha]